MCGKKCSGFTCRECYTNKKGTQVSRLYAQRRHNK